MFNTAISYLNRNKEKLGFGDYTQLVWANSSLVGCGVSVFQQPGRSLSYTLVAACNWGPAGNMPGKGPDSFANGMYKTGPQTFCDPGWFADAKTGLCVD